MTRGCSDKPVNQFERAGRAEKVAKLLRALDLVAREMGIAGDDDRLIAWLGHATAEDKRKLYVLAGAKPSKTNATWEALIDDVRERKAFNERFAGAPDDEPPF